jgi:putative spermidine/putrescine transport system permease protein
VTDAVPGRGLPRWARITLLLTPALTVIAVFFVAGIGQAVAQSLGHQPFLPGSRLSFDAYRSLAQDPAVRASLLLSLRVALLSTAVATVLGVMLALLLRHAGRSRRWLGGVLQGNLAVPHVVAALCVLLLLAQGGLLSRLSHALGWTGRPADFPALTGDAFGWGIIAAYVWKETPFLMMVTLAALSGGIEQLENAARMLGAGPVRRLVSVTLPLVAPPVAAGSVLVFAFAFGSYEVPYLLGRPYPATLPVVAYQYYRDTDLTLRPQAMAVAVLITALSVLLVAGYLALVRRLARRAL